MSNRPELLAHKFHPLGDGGRIRYALFEPEKAHGTVLIAPGRREFIEKKYAELGPALLKRNCRLIFFEWRGQGLSDRFLTGKLHQRDHITDFGTHLNDLTSFYDKVIHPRQTGPLLVFGHSMGSHLLLRWLVECQIKAAAAIIIAPMLALAALPVHAAARAMSWTAVHLGHNTDYAPGQHDYNDRDRAFDKNPLSHDLERYTIIEKYFDAHPEMTVGGVTWGWLDAALKSMNRTYQRHYFERLTLPILALTGSGDHVTPPTELDRYLRRLPNAHNFIIPGARHDLMNEADIYQIEAWKHIDRFLDKVMNA